MLLKVQEYYRRHPETEGRIKPHFARLLESDDPQAVERLRAGVPFDQIDLAPEQLPPAWAEGELEAEVVEYLRYHHFDLGPRLEFVSQEVARLNDSVGAVPCPRCETGRLYVPPEDWDEFTARSGITWYWPDWYSIEGDGTLHVKTTGWRGEAHWTGESVIAPDQPDYAFWRWLVAQKKYHRLIEEAELITIQQVWSRRTNHGG